MFMLIRYNKDLILWHIEGRCHAITLQNYMEKEAEQIWKIIDPVLGKMVAIPHKILDWVLDLISSIQSLSHVWLFATPWIAARQVSLSIIISRSSLRFTSIESVMPSSHLILCCSLFLLPPIPPSIRVFSNESTLRMRWPKFWSVLRLIVIFQSGVWKCPEIFPLTPLRKISLHVIT